MSTSELLDEKKFAKDLKEVQGQYLDYPYPFRNPEDEKSRLITLQADSLMEINHYLFNGKQDFKNHFRVLIAGGGTGDAAIYHGEQLRNTNAQIFYLDFSKASMEIAKERAKIRKLTNIKWINDSILNLPKLGIGKFDLINCVGVLHHLESPDEGLQALKKVLKPDGGMSLMVYAKYGRTGLYQVQEIMQMVNDGEVSRQKEVENGWAIVNALPCTNWFNRGAELLNDHIAHGDVGMYDMFLHKRDKAYTVPEIYEFVERAGLHFIEFSDPFERAVLDIRSFIGKGELTEKIMKMDKIKQQAICEIMAGSIIKHPFWVTNRSDSTIASFDDFDNIPYFYGKVSYPQDIKRFLDENPDQVGLPITFNLEYFGKSVKLSFITSEFTKYIFEALIPQNRTLTEILEFVQTQIAKEMSLQEFKTEIESTVKPMADAGVMYLRHKSVNFRMI